MHSGEVHGFGRRILSGARFWETNLRSIALKAVIQTEPALFLAFLRDHNHTYGPLQLSDRGARFRETNPVRCTLLGDECARRAKGARFRETNRTLSGDESHAFGRRIARFRETNRTLSGDEFEFKLLKTLSECRG
jgi:hypothetical protein